ncbi:MAG: mechanosensitive ion channel family protein [Lachnospiraceae bacterium]|nr:mechanosensitive ion channel family protein [Lachnospiraceae bacterium]
MENNGNYEALKGSAKSFIQVITSDNLYYGIFLLVLLIVAVKVIDLIFKPLKRKNSIHVSFLKGCMKAFCIITIGIKICSLSQVLSGFASQILMSSSLIVVVLGFVFQEGLTNIVHGFILSIFKPFNIGDRVRIAVDGQSITGYVQSIDLRSTIIQNVVNSSHVIVPNSKMDMCVIDNSYFDADSVSSNFLDFSISYESNLEKALAVTSQEIASHPFVHEVRAEAGIQEPVVVLVRELGDSGICLRASVVTKTVEKNFAACSDIRRSLVHRFQAEADLDFAYPHVQIVGEEKYYD